MTQADIEVIRKSPYENHLHTQHEKNTYALNKSVKCLSTFTSHQSQMFTRYKPKSVKATNGMQANQELKTL